mgnify:CR=1 FL=1
MAIIFDTTRNTKIEFYFTDNGKLDLTNPDPFQQWVPYTFIIEFNGHKYEFKNHEYQLYGKNLEWNYTLNVKEINRISSGIKRIIFKKKYSKIEEIMPFSHITADVDFEILLEDLIDTDTLSINLWLNQSAIVNNVKSMNKVGLSTIFYYQDVKRFLNELGKNLKQIAVSLGDYSEVQFLPQQEYQYRLAHTRYEYQNGLDDDLDFILTKSNLIKFFEYKIKENMYFVDIKIDDITLSIKVINQIFEFISFGNFNRCQKIESESEHVYDILTVSEPTYDIDVGSSSYKASRFQFTFGVWEATI